jgi:hypothetical protein
MRLSKVPEVLRTRKRGAFRAQSHSFPFQIPVALYAR